MQQMPSRCSVSIESHTSLHREDSILSKLGLKMFFSNNTFIKVVTIYYRILYFQIFFKESKNT